MEFYFETLYGDLTRIGNFSERDFGWRLAQPAVPVEQFKDYPLAEADIVVIGDSFSVTGVWQTRLLSEGLKVSTLEWQDLKTAGLFGSLPSDLANILRTAGFKGRYVVIESVERLFQQRVKILSTEHNLIKHDIAINTAPITKRERILLEKLNGVAWGKKALYNKIKLSLNLPEKKLKSGMVKVVNFAGCELFSHRLCQYAIFMDEDFKKETFNAIDNVLTVNKNLQASGMQAIWMIVPDKSTVYLGYGQLNIYPYQNIWQTFAQYPELIAPDLGTAFLLKSRLIKDFYLPNDTHLSTHGFLYLGDMMAKEMRNLNQVKPFEKDLSGLNI